MSREGVQRAAMLIDKGAAGHLQHTGLKGRSETCGKDYLENQGVRSMRAVSTREKLFL